MERMVLRIALCGCLLFMSLIVKAQREELDGESQYREYQIDGVKYRIADQPWPIDGKGAQRALISVPEGVDTNTVVRVELTWRRADVNPEKKAVVVTTQDGLKVRQMHVLEIAQERGVVDFVPEGGAGHYYVYYMPYNLFRHWAEGRGMPGWNDYLPFQPLNSIPEHLGQQKPVRAREVCYESRTKFDFFTQMGITALPEEEKEILNEHPENPVLFTEDRAFPIRLTHHLAYRMVEQKPRLSFEGTAMRNEYYTFQVAAWAANGDVKGLKLEFSDLRNKATGETIDSQDITCFNQEGINWDGTKMERQVDVKQGEVQALWCGVQIPEKASEGIYEGTIVCRGKDGVEQQKIALEIKVLPELLADKGDADLWRMARLRWLNSIIGINDNPVAPYKAMTCRGKTIRATEKTLHLNSNGMPSQIEINGREVLAEDMRFVVETNDGNLHTFESKNLQVSKKADGRVDWQTSAEKGDLSFLCKAWMEYDGYIHYDVEIKSTTGREIAVKDVRLETHYTPYASQYMIGIGYLNGDCPSEHVWRWDDMYDSFWLGGTLAGLHMEYLGASYSGPLLSDYRPGPPLVWYNGGKGTVELTKNEHGATVISHTGNDTIRSDAHNFEFALFITPVKPVDTRKQFSMRFFHADHKIFDRAALDGANIANIHHASPLNPYINYPFIVQDSLRAFINHEHEEGRKVKLYYTIRELTNHVSEIYALKSLGDEIIAPGPGMGSPWLWEHLIDNYRPAWYVCIDDEHQDAAFVQSGISRWINYYLEGLRWMFQNYEIDGVYIDAVSFDHEVMKRLRKIIAQYRPEAVVDMHAHLFYTIGPANQYTGIMPYLDRLWFGEEFHYNEMTPSEWLVNFSGIPFGPMGEMLQDGGNKYLGMLFGACTRHSYGPTDPSPIWKLWRDFGIEDAKMIGFWEEGCPVTTDNLHVKATVFLRKGKVLVAVGNFGVDDAKVHLNINYKALRMNPQKVRWVLPAIKDFQPASQLDPNATLHIPGKKGCVIEISL